MNDKPHYISALDVEEWATKCINLERERDEVREEISSIRNALSQNGEAVGNGEHHFSIIEMVENLIKSRDYFIRKSDSLERERDEAREDLEFRRGLYKVLDEANSHLMTVNEEAVKLARTLKQERNEAMDVLSNLSHYLSCGLGDENTTAQEYGARIREGINALTDPIVEEKEKLRKMLDLQTKIVVDLEMRLMK